MYVQLTKDHFTATYSFSKIDLQHLWYVLHPTRVLLAYMSHTMMLCSLRTEVEFYEVVELGYQTRLVATNGMFSTLERG